MGQVGGWRLKLPAMWFKWALNAGSDQVREICQMGQVRASSGSWAAQVAQVGPQWFKCASNGAGLGGSKAKAARATVEVGQVGCSNKWVRWAKWAVQVGQVGGSRRAFTWVKWVGPVEVT